MGIWVLRVLSSVLNQAPRWFEDAVEDAKQTPKITWHCLRHTWATRLIQRGADVKTLQELGGWKSIDMVMRYAHANSKCFAPALEMLCQTLTPQLAPHRPKRTKMLWRKRCSKMLWLCSLRSMRARSSAVRAGDS